MFALKGIPSKGCFLRKNAPTLMMQGLFHNVILDNARIWSCKQVVHVIDTIWSSQ